MTESRHINDQNRVIIEEVRSNGGESVHGDIVLITHTGCQFPCNQAPVVSIGVPTDPAVEGGPTQVTVTVANPDAVSFDLVVLRVHHSRWLRLRHSDRPYGMALRPHRSYASRQLRRFPRPRGPRL